mmetsp:Transcript_32883/g.104881  ORF Transcript_32883/g.104881 Transcript_32883/m.104881 type:complete len:84 (-) Transcript_32883:2005-2256(-)
MTPRNPPRPALSSDKPKSPPQAAEPRASQEEEREAQAEGECESAGATTRNRKTETETEVRNRNPATQSHRIKTENREGEKKEH